MESIMILVKRGWNGNQKEKHLWEENMGRKQQQRRNQVKGEPKLGLEIELLETERVSPRDLMDQTVTFQVHVWRG